MAISDEARGRTYPIPRSGHGAEAFLQLQEQAPSLLDFAVEHSLQRASSGSIDDRIRSVDEILRILQKTSHRIEQEECMRRVAERLGLNQQRLIERYPEVRSKAAHRSPGPSVSQGQTLSKRQHEEWDLAYCLLQGKLTAAHLRALRADLFSEPVCRRLLEIGLRHLDRDGRVMNKADFTYPESVSIRGYNPTYDGNKWQIKQAAEAISKAKKPVLYIGGGVVFSGASEEVRELAELCQIPVDMTLMALGAFPGEHPLSMGMMGMHGTYWANMAVHYSDLVIAVGARFDDRVTGKVSEFCPHAKIIHIDIDPTSIKKNIHVDIPIVGDCKRVLRELIQVLKATVNGDQKDLRKPWWDQINEWRQAHPLSYEQDPNGPIKPQHERRRKNYDRQAAYPTQCGYHRSGVCLQLAGRF